MSQIDKTDRINKIISTLRVTMGRPLLDGYSDPYKCLIATILSQRTRDENTRIAAEQLFAKYPDAKSLASAPIPKIEQLIRPSGFYHNKAKTIKQVARRVQAGVPNNIEGLLALPGVGRKTANCVLVYGYGIPAIPIDTHCHRIPNRLGLVKTKAPEETETALAKIAPRKCWGEINSLFVRLGQTICRPAGPKCYVCPIAQYCTYSQKRPPKREKA